MSALLWAAVVLIAALAVAHSYLGERYIVRRLLRRDLPKLFGGETFTRLTIRYAWHVTTVAWLGFAVLLGYLASAGAISLSNILMIVAATSGASALVAIVLTRGKHLSWVVFVAIAGLVAWAAVAASIQY